MDYDDNPNPRPMVRRLVNFKLFLFLLIDLITVVNEVNVNERSEVNYLLYVVA